MWKLAIAITLAAAVGVEGATTAKMSQIKKLQHFLKMKDNIMKRKHEKPEIKFLAPCTNQTGAKPGEVFNCPWRYVVDKFDNIPSVAFHNGLRFKLALGAEWHGPSGHQPSGYLEKMNASDELAVNATQMAISYIKNPGAGKKVPNGFNIYDAVAIKKPIREEWVDAFNHWYSGITLYHYSLEFKSNPDTDGYTQMVWANTNWIGCASIKYTQEKPKLPSRRIQVCAYNPPGNIEGQRVYKEKHFCDNCLNGCIDDRIDICFR